MTTDTGTPNEQDSEELNFFAVQIGNIFNDIVDKIDSVETSDLRTLMMTLDLHDLDGEDLSAADLSGQDLSGLSFRHVRFVGADCTGTNFAGSDLSHADFTSAKLVGANFVGARLAGTVGLTPPVQTKRAASGRLYEHVFLARQELAEAEVQALVQHNIRMIERCGGAVLKTEDWGRKNLAYRIAHNRAAHYIMLVIDAPAGTISELERQSNINEDIIRHMTIRVDAVEEGPSVMIKKRKSLDQAVSPASPTHWQYRSDGRN